MQYYFITGTSRGIGKALAQRILQEKDVKVVGIGRKNSIINPNYRHITLDLADVALVEKQAAQLFPRLIDPKKIVLINNSGIIGEVAHVGKHSAGEIRKVLEVNTIAPMLLTHAFVRSYQSLECPKTIVNVSSVAAKNPLDGWAPYCTSKAALDMFSRAVADEQQHMLHPIRTFAIAPGVVDTAMQEQIRASNPKDFRLHDRFMAYKNEGQLSTPADVAERYWRFLQQEEHYEEVLLDARHF